MRVVFILGSGHCGSTLLDLLLDGHSRIVGVGELSTARVDSVCACGRRARECPFWQSALGSEPWRGQQVHRRKLAFLTGRGPYLSGSTREPIDADAYVRATELTYSRIRDVADADIIVDSSKSPEQAELLSRSHIIEPIVLHLVRDGRGVTFSYIRKYEKRLPYFFVWARSNLKVDALRRRVRGKFPFLFIRYEDLVADPSQLLRQLCNILEISFEPEMLDFRANVHHEIGGNRMRFGADRAISADDTWRSAMPLPQRALFNICFGGLNLYYANRRSLR